MRVFYVLSLGHVAGLIVYWDLSRNSYEDHEDRRLNRKHQKN